MATVHSLDPLRDIRWQMLVDRHPHGSVFHTTGWLDALRRTYGYEPIVFTTSSPTEELTNGLLFCRVKSWLTGQRMVSLPFSDYCEPLCDTGELEFLVRYLQSTLDHQKCKYMEIRPFDECFARMAQTVGFRGVDSYLLHRVDLRPTIEDVFQSFDKDSIQRRVHHANRSGLIEKTGRSVKLLQDFYNLLVLTRHRHQLPPQPYVWFRNLVQCLGEELEIRIAYKEDAPIASILTLRFRDMVYYKYGCSDTKFNHLGATPLLLWKSITEAKSNGATVFDLGRTELANTGLITFKNHWACKPQGLLYWKFPSSPTEMASFEWKLRLMKRVFSLMPNRVLTLTGKFLYPHIG
jgi:lipid II:glycine glycyltransferase (peptidoglycan interpeptide bridge formation enzyme)